jgi:hypothetical protein
MKVKRARKAIITLLIIITLIVLLYMASLVISYNNLIRDETIPLGGIYENIELTRTTRRVPLKLVYQFEIDGELPTEYKNYSCFYDVMSVKTLNERFGAGFETEDEDGWVAISHGRVIKALFYDINWRLANYMKDWGNIAVPLYERDYSPNTIYVYTSRFPLKELYTGERQGYFSSDIRHDDDNKLRRFVIDWNTYNPSLSPKDDWWQGFWEFERINFHWVILVDE